MLLSQHDRSVGYLLHVIGLSHKKVMCRNGRLFIAYRLTHILQKQSMLYPLEENFSVYTCFNSSADIQ